MSATENQANIQLAIVGCGIRGHLYANSLLQTPGVTVDAVVDANSEKADALANEIGASAYATVSAMLSRHADIDAAIIATPDFAHTDPAVECAQHGIHLMIEKPLATDVVSAHRIMDTAASHNALIMVAFENRWNPRFSEARRLVDEGAVGNISNIIAQLNDTIYVPTQMLPWAAKSSSAWFLMPHTLDLALWYTGATPVEVYAKGTRGVLDAQGVNTWDAITALVGLSDGSTVTLHSSWILPASKPAVFEFCFEIQGNDGVLTLDGATHGMALYGSVNATRPQLGVHWRHGEIRGHAVDMVRDFIRYVRGERIKVPTGADGLIVTATIEAVHQALDSNALITIHGSRSGSQSGHRNNSL